MITQHRHNALSECKVSEVAALIHQYISSVQKFLSHALQCLHTVCTDLYAPLKTQARQPPRVHVTPALVLPIEPVQLQVPPQIVLLVLIRSG